MDSSAFFSIIFTIVVVIISYYFYKPVIELPNLELMRKNLKDLVDYNIYHNIKREETVEHFESLTPEKLFTAKELSEFTGNKNGPIYLSILGKVFDVTKGKKYYGVGENYHGFTGRDASRAFITGDFTEDGLVDDISDFSDNQIGDLNEWVKKYERDYVYKGKLIGKFYDRFGKSTKQLENIEKTLSRLSENKEMDDFYKKTYPPCNAEWTPETGSRVWCSRLSGGIKRDWIGVPRKFHQPGTSVSRCACINLKGLEIKQGNLEVYKNCDPSTASCYLT